MTKRLVVTFPDIGEGVVEGEVIEWLKKEGESIKKDEPVVVVMTDKATVELPSPQVGILAKCHVAEGKLALKDKPLYEIDVDDDVSLPPSHEHPKKEPIKPEVPIKPISQPVNHTSDQRGIATPKIRHLARDLGVDIGQLQGSGKDGRVLIQDLNPSLQTEPSTPLLHLPDDEEQPVIGIRQLMARKMAESKRLIPHFSYFETVDVSRLIQLRSHVKPQAEDEGIHLTYMPFLIKALSMCIKEFPQCNSSYDVSNGKLIIHHQHNIGIAVASGYGLIVPVIKGVQTLDMEKLIHAYDELMKRAQTNKLSPSDMRDGTISLSNFGTSGHGSWATPIINYPEVAILAMARIQPQSMVKNGETVVREGLNLSWSFDHRVIDGDQAVKISHHFCQLLKNPASLL